MISSAGPQTGAAPGAPAAARPLVLIVGPPAAHPALLAALHAAPCAAAALSPAGAGAAVQTRSPALLLCVVAAPPDLALVQELSAAGDAPVLALLPADAPDLAHPALAAGASEYLFGGDDNPALIRWHVEQALAAARQRGRVAGLEADLVRLTRQVQVLTEQDQRQSADLLRLSHDLRGQLTYLVGYSELLGTQDEASPAVQQMAGEILRAARNLTVLIEHLTVRAPPVAP